MELFCEAVSCLYGINPSPFFFACIHAELNPESPTSYEDLTGLLQTINAAEADTASLSQCLSYCIIISFDGEFNSLMYLADTWSPGCFFFAGRTVFDLRQPVTHISKGREASF